MKTAKFLVEAVSVWCPECDSFYENDEGSSVWQIGFSETPHHRDVLRCRTCGAEFRVPKYDHSTK